MFYPHNHLYRVADIHANREYLPLRDGEFAGANHERLITAIWKEQNASREPTGRSVLAIQNQCNSCNMSDQKTLDVSTHPGSPSSDSDFEAGGLASGSTNPFKDHKTAEFYRRVYEESQYECREAFDPDLEWTREEEKKIVRRLDWHVCLWACIMFFALQLDRGNISQAVSDNLLDDLNLSTTDYNYGESTNGILFAFI